jgi:hypothetical protein
LWFSPVSTVCLSERAIPVDVACDGTAGRVTERNLPPAMRLLVGAFGVGVLALGLIVATAELQRAYQGAPPGPAILAAAVCLLIAFSGASLVSSAARGRITLRRTVRRPPAK